MLACQQELFDLPAGEHFLNCAYMGPLPRTVQEAGVAGIRAKAAPLAIGPEDFFRDADRARALFAGLIGAPRPERVAILPSVSYGMAVVARNVKLAAGSNVVIAAEQFPSNVYPWRKACARAGAELRVVARPASATPGQAWNGALLEAVDGATALVALAPLHWTDGTVFDVAALGARARQVGARFVLDGTQAVGAMPLDVTEVRPDALIVAAYKWLLGPSGMALGWFGPAFDDGEPLEEGWITRGGSRDFQGLVDYRDDYEPGAIRFDVGERSNFILLPMVVAALELVGGWGSEAVRDYCGALMADAITEARELGYGVEEDRWRAAHLFGLRAPAGVELAALHAALERRRVRASLRGTALRVAPNVYNDAGDAAALMEALRAARG